MKRALVTGGSGGIGLAVCSLLAGRGYDVTELSRHDAGTAGVTHINCDVSDPAQVAAAVGKTGAVDILILNAGYGISGAVEFTSAEDAARQMDVNFGGCVRTLRAAIPHMRENGGGHILIIGSVASVFPIPFQAFYSASKAALAAMSYALRNELRGFGISVTAVLPGDVHTGFTDARHKSSGGNEIYGGAVESSVAAMEKDERGGIDPVKAAAAVVRIAEKKHPGARYIIGSKYRLFVFLSRLLPESLAVWAVGKMYICSGKKPEQGDGK